jgi:hypothetical protein
MKWGWKRSKAVALNEKELKRKTSMCCDRLERSYAEPGQNAKAPARAGCL